MSRQEADDVLLARTMRRILEADDGFWDYTYVQADPTGYVVVDARIFDVPGDEIEAINRVLDAKEEA